MRALPRQAGFSAVELLITLFVGFLFISMGFQLYSVIINQSNDEGNYAQAGFVATYYARQWINGNSPYGIPLDFSACPSSPFQTTQTDSPTTSLTVRWECPNPANLPALRLLTVTRKVKNTEASYASYFTYPQ